MTEEDGGNHGAGAIGNAGKDTTSAIVHDESDDRSDDRNVAVRAEVQPSRSQWLREDRRLPWLAIGALTILLLAVYSGVFRGEPAGDDLTFHLAEIRRIADCFRAGDFDLWNTSANAGYASAYYYQVIPLAVPAAIAAITGTDVLFWFQLSIVLPLALVPLAGYRGMRLLGATRWGAVAAAAAVPFAISSSRWGHGADGTFTVGLYTQTWAFAAFPLALGHAFVWITRGRNLGAAIAWGAFVGMCHPFAGIALGVAVVAGVICDAVTAPIAAGARRVLGNGAVAALARRLAVTPLSHEQPAADEGAITPRLVRVLGLGTALLLASAAAWLPVVIDYSGFGGFPHRVADEDGPGFVGLMRWYALGGLLDSRRVQALTWALPLVLLLARARYLRWLWGAALAYAFLLSIGPHLITQDDLLPAVRFLGSLQIVLALGIGAGLLPVGARLRAVLESRFGAAAANSALVVLAAAMIGGVVGWGSLVQVQRLRVAGDDEATHRSELMRVIDALAKAPPGRKQGLDRAGNHWWNLLPFVYAERPALLQMGGGGLQSSPNYDFLWTHRDPARTAWLFDAPYVASSLPVPSSVPAGRVLIKTKHYEVRQLPAPGLVSPVQVTGVLPYGRKVAHRAALDWLANASVYRDQLLAYAGYGGSGPAPQATVLAVRRNLSSGDEPDIIAEVQVETASTFVFRDSWHPRWTGLIDGKAVPVRRLTPDFPALDVGPGTHTIALRFDRPWWAFAAWLLWPMLAVAGSLATRRRKSSTSPAKER